MIKLKIEDIVRITGGELLSGNPDTDIQGFSIDSRTILPGEFFIAIKGQNFDGMDFIQDAQRNGAGGIIIPSRCVRLYNGSGNCIVVEDTMRAMSDVAAHIRSFVNVPVICITGTNGKTTVKDMLYHILSSKYKVLKSPKSYNNKIGVSLTLFGLESYHEVVVMELGTNHPGEIADLSGILKPDIAVITNIGNGHLEHFVDRNGVFSEKTSILANLSGHGMAFLNGDDDILRARSYGNGHVRFYGTGDGAHIAISEISRRNGGYDFRLTGERFFIPLEGEHNVYNAAAAIAVAKFLGMRFDDIVEALRGLSLPSMRLERVEVDRLTFINDSYNANPDSFVAALNVLADSPGGRKGVVAGDMLELGDRTRELHEKAGRNIAEKGIDFLVTLGDKAAYIAKGAIFAGMNEDNVICVTSHKEAAKAVSDMCGDCAVVLVKGSRASKMEEVIRCYSTYCIR